ncbi:proteasome subunit beta [archaeon]|nr:proteasome subunit beta [archaeon]
MEQSMKKPIQTGTTTIGIKCKDGIVILADKRSSAGHLVASKEMNKVQIITPNIVITQAGLVSDAQLLTKLIKAELKIMQIRRGEQVKVREAANLLGTFLYHNIRKMSMVPGIVGFLLGGGDNEGFKLYDLGVDGSVTEHTDFAVTGSGSELALGVLESLHDKNLSIENGIKLGLKAINSAVRRDLASGDGIDVFTINDQGAKKVMTKVLETNVFAQS